MRTRILFPEMLSSTESGHQSSVDFSVRPVGSVRASPSFSRRQHRDIAEAVNESLPPVSGRPSQASHPAKFGHYKVTAVLGSGIATNIYRAETEGIGRVVVLKVLRSTTGRESIFFRRFEREARLLSSLRHPNLIELFDYDAGVASERPPYMVLEHVDGATLLEVLQRAPRLEPEEAAAVALEVTRALAHAHSRGVTHRDVKPANILIGRTSAHEEGQADRVVVKLADLGVASEENDPEGESIGTPAYMSPEQLLGESIDHRADQFALGIVLYQMLAGARPFDGDDGRPAIQRIRRDPPRPFKNVGVTVPRVLERIVLRLLAKRPSDRFERTDEVVAELTRFLESRVDHLDNLTSIHRRVLARSGVLDERKTMREEVVSRVSSMRAGPIRVRAVPLTPTIVGIAAAAIAMTIGGAYIQWKMGGIREKEAPKPLAPPTADGTDTARIKVLVRPWAEVILDGKRVDVTPLPHPLAVRPGRHVILLQHPSVTERRVLDVGPGQQITLDIALNVPSPNNADEFLPPPINPPASASVSSKPSAAPVPSTLSQP
jgi:eukaryotic-like serine/threonine-protein kinase